LGSGNAQLAPTRDDDDEEARGATAIGTHSGGDLQIIIRIAPSHLPPESFISSAAQFSTLRTSDYRLPCDHPSMRRIRIPDCAENKPAANPLARG
jgi:hypothetical protein